MLQKVLCFLGFHKWGKAREIPYPIGWKFQREDRYWQLCERDCEVCGYKETYQTL